MVGQIDVREGLETAWTRIAAFFPKFLGFILILLIGYAIAKILEKILSRVLERVGFDRVVERGGIKKALDRSKFDASDILARIVFYLVFLFVLQLAFGVFGPNPISDLIQGIVTFLPRLFVAIVIIVITGAIAAAVRELVDAALGGLSYGKALAGIAMALIWFVGLAAALNQIRVAPEIVNGLFYAVLALIVGSAIVAIGGGGIEPMRERWQRALTKLDEEAPRVKQEVEGASDRIKDRAEQRSQQLRDETSG